ncbi:hypothetical protein ACOME3_010367 [Neoechinorhynchus agilis]
MMRNMFLSWIGPSAYQLLSSLNTGKDVNNYDYHELIELLDTHHSRPIHIVAARFAFSQYEMKNGQSYASWIVDLREEAGLCQFFNKSINSEKDAIDDRIRDQIAIGTPHDEVRNKILQMAAPSLSGVMKICETFEMIKNTSWRKQYVGQELPNDSYTAKYMQDGKFFEIDMIRKRHNTRDQREKRPKQRCKRCGIEHEISVSSKEQELFQTLKDGSFQIVLPIKVPSRSN